MLNKDSSNFHWNPGIPVVRPTVCPIEQPMSGSSCPLPEGTQCSYGEECCCGECHTRWENPSNLISHSVSNTLSSLYMCSLAIYYRQASSFMQELILIVHQYLSICPMTTKQSHASATHVICSASWWTAEEAHGSALTPTPASTQTVTHQVSAHKSNYFPQAHTFTMYSSWNNATVIMSL